MDFNISDWLNGYPRRVRRGFEIIRIDPEILYVMFSTNEDMKKFRKKYSVYIDHDFEVNEEDIQEASSNEEETNYS